MNLTLDIGGCNVVGAEMRANGVLLGKTPVRIKLSEFLAKVPDWEKAPGPTWAAGSSTARKDSTANAMPRDLRWGTMQLPDLKFIRLPEDLATQLRGRQGRYVYIEVEYNGERGERTGSTNGGGGDENYGLNIGFRFPHREAQIERLLDQARLADCQVDPRWLQAATEFGPDAWIAIWQAQAHEPDMQKVADAWAHWQYDLNDTQGFDGAWQAFERIRNDADEQGHYSTASLRRAVELLSPQLVPWRLVDEAEPLIDSVTSISFSRGIGPTNEAVLSVYAENARPIQMATRDGGSGTTLFGGNPVERLKPSGLALAHAIWLVNRRMTEADSANNTPNIFQDRLTPLLLRADAERRGPVAIRLATMLGGPAAEKYLIRQANRTQHLRWEDSPGEFEFGAENVNRWFYWAAQLLGPAGRQFREQHLDALFDMADQFAPHLSGIRENVAEKMPFLFVENECGPESIGRRYWPRFRGIVAARPHSALYDELGYLVALGPAADSQMFVDVIFDAWSKRRDNSQIVEFIQWRMPDIPVNRQVEILDRLIPAIAEELKSDPTKNGSGDYVLRQLREARYLEIDDAASVAYLMKWLRDQLSEDERPGLSRDWFVENLSKSAARRSMLIAALAVAPEADFRLLAVKMIRAQPTPQSRKFLPDLLQDDDENVRKAAAAAETYWNTLQSTSG